MYNSCEEVIETLLLPGNQGLDIVPAISYSLAFINFGTTQINCNCDQAYILEMLQGTFGQFIDLAGFPIYNATCTNGTTFLSSSCAPGTTIQNSSVDFSQVYPRQCKVDQSEPGVLTNVQNISVPTLNAVSDEFIKPIKASFLLMHRFPHLNSLIR
jgi:hypothetical protein